MTELLTVLSIMFIVAGPLLFLANRLDIPPAPTLLVAGVVAGQFIEEGLLLDLARFGIALLLFGFGARVQLDSIRTVLRDSEVVAIGQVFVLGVLGTAGAWFLGVAPEHAIYIGVAAALSSTIVGTALLAEDIYREQVHGRLAESIHLIQDGIAIVFVLLVGAETFAPDPIATQLGYGVMLLLTAVAINRYLFAWLDRLAGGSDELLTIGSIALLVGFLGLVEVIGVSIVVGGFAAGLAVRADRDERLGLVNGIDSIMDFFVAIVFVAIGALLTWPSPEVLLLAGVLGGLTVLVKPAVTYALLVRQGYDARASALTSLSLDQVSEFALIVTIEGLVAGLVTQPVFDGIILAAAITMITSSLTFAYDERVYRTLREWGVIRDTHGKAAAWSDVPDDLSDHVIIVGYGRLGRSIARHCEEQGHPYVVIENDPAHREDLEVECEAYLFGDATAPGTWSRAHAARASLVVSTVEADSVSQRLLEFEVEPGLMLRTQSVERARSYLEQGATFVVVPDLLASDRLLEHIDRLTTGEITGTGLREEELATYPRGFPQRSRPIGPP